MQLHFFAESDILNPFIPSAGRDSFNDMSAEGIVIEMEMSVCVIKSVLWGSGWII